MTSYFYGSEIIYLALFGRPVDPEGHTWINEVTDVFDNLGAASIVTASEEYRSMFEDDLGGNHEDMIAHIYQNLFDREPDEGGLDFYASQYEQGMDMATVAFNIVLGATSGEDLDTLNVKVMASKAFTRELDTDLELVAYVGEDAAEVGYNYLDPINADNIPADGFGPGAQEAVELLVSSTPGDGSIEI